MKNPKHIRVGGVPFEALGPDAQRWVLEQTKGIAPGPGSPVLDLAAQRQRAPLRHDEEDAQVALFAWAREAEAVVPALRWLFAVPNGGKRGAKTAKAMKAQGVKRGVLDAWLPVKKVAAHGVTPGLVLEAKTEAGRWSDEQLAWRDHLLGEGWVVEQFITPREARGIICTYLGITDPFPDREY